MRAVVLVGGFGTRLRPLTWATPKQMLPVVDRPMIEWVVGWLGSHGVTEAILSLGYRPDAFTGAYPDGVLDGVRLCYAVEPEPLDTAGAIAFAARAAGVEETFAVVNGDVLTDFDLGSLWAAHQRAGAEGTIHLTEVDDPSRYGVVPIDEAGRVEAFVEKPPPDEAPSTWINAGTYVLEPSVLDRIPGQRRVSIERETFPALVADRSLYAVASDAYWIDAGTPETYLRAQLDLISGRRPHHHPDAVDAGASVEATASVVESVVMSGARVDAGAEVRRAALLPGARIDRDAVVRDSIVGPGSRVGPGAELGSLCVLGEDVEVAPGATLVGARVPGEEEG